MGTRRALTAVVTAAALATLAACTEDVNDGHIYVTQMYGDGCTYDEERGGIVFRFDVAGRKDADMIAEVRRSAPGADEDHPGPVLASAVHEIRGGDYENPITIVARRVWAFCWPRKGPRVPPRRRKRHLHAAANPNS